MNKISNREKSLLVFLAVVAICVVSFMFIIKPILNTKDEQKAEIAALEVEVAADKLVHDGLDKLKQELKDCENIIEESKKGFYNTAFEDYNSEREVTQVFDKNNMNVKITNISEPVPFEEKKTEEEMKADKRTEEQKKADLENSPAEIVTVTLQYAAPVENLKQCLDDFAKSKKRAAITSWSYMIKDGKFQGTLVMELYLLKD